MCIFIEKSVHRVIVWVRDYAFFVQDKSIYGFRNAADCFPTRDEISIEPCLPEQKIIVYEIRITQTRRNDKFYTVSVSGFSKTFVVLSPYRAAGITLFAITVVSTRQSAGDFLSSSVNVKINETLRSSPCVPNTKQYEQVFGKLYNVL